MAPLEQLAERYISSSSCPSGYYYRTGYGCTRSGWSSFGRWILLAGIIVFFFILFFLWACFNTRRRRRRGLQPRYGTGWVGNSKWGGGNNYNNPQAYNQPPPPAYGAGAQGYNQGYNNQAYPMRDQPTGNTFQTTDGYYGQHEGVQQPKNTYQNTGANDYAPPAGPPPGKVVR